MDRRSRPKTFPLSQSVASGEDVSLSATSFVDDAAKFAASTNEELADRSAQFLAFALTCNWEPLGWSRMSTRGCARASFMAAGLGRTGGSGSYIPQESGGASRGARYLEPWLRYDGSFVGERAGRVAAARRAWRALNNFFTSGAILRLRLLVFQCVVMVIIFSGVLPSVRQPS